MGQTNIPEPPPAIPQRGNSFSRFIGRSMMSASGWTIEGNFPNEPKYIIAIVPHTSNMDFLVGLNVLLSMGLRLEFMGKESLFWEPQGTLLRWLGGVPVNRDAPGGTVRQIVKQFEESEQFVLVITPEGTRRKVEKWKTGFYRIAEKAGVPIVPTGFDYLSKTIKIGPPLWPSGDMEADFAALRAFYAGITARFPDKA
ncbi:MAG: lysophospholipid acyltransferase family protein [Candidatus Promineifilaceae bacterium]